MNREFRNLIFQLSEILDTTVDVLTVYEREDHTLGFVALCYSNTERYEIYKGSAADPSKAEMVRWEKSGRTAMKKYLHVLSDSTT